MGRCGIENRVRRHEEEFFVLLQPLLLCELIDELEWQFRVSNARPGLLDMGQR